LSDEEADAAWALGNQRLLGEGIHLASPPNVSSFTGGNTLKVMADVQHPEQGKIQAKIALDTQSDVTTCLREFLTNIRPIYPDEISGVGGSSLFFEEGILCVIQKRVSAPIQALIQVRWRKSKFENKVVHHGEPKVRALLSTIESFAQFQ
jgi:hypothetical protein